MQQGSAPLTLAEQETLKDNAHSVMRTLIKYFILKKTDVWRSAQRDIDFRREDARKHALQIITCQEMFA
jgi:hypothetical protein